MGVSITPCGVLNNPARAVPSMAWRVKRAIYEKSALTPNPLSPGAKVLSQLFD
jgi:hypothetical protein